MGNTVRKTSMLADIPGRPVPPSLEEVEKARIQAGFSGATLDLDDIQGDVLIGMLKHYEHLYFFGIKDATTFKAKLKSQILPRITSTRQLLDVTKQPLCAVNLAFSQTGLNALGVKDDLGDPLFKVGQEVGADSLGDPGTTNWVKAFLGKAIHGIFLLESDTAANVATERAALKKILGDSVVDLYDADGALRPGDQKGHEPFGYLDGISQPAVAGFHFNPSPGQIVVRPGVIVVGEPGDPVSQRPAWTKGGSFLVFRELSQLVPEFDKYIHDNAILEFGLTPEEGAQLMGARMIGRWKSGTPVDVSPLRDDPSIGPNPRRNNDFNYIHYGHDISSNQTCCPFSAHTRKTNPRGDADPETVSKHQIFRAGIAYGPEVTPAEASKQTTIENRGILVVDYQSDIATGFLHQQQRANDPVEGAGKTTPAPNKDPIQPGFDLLLGTNGGQERFITGLDPTRPGGQHKMPNFVVSHGGEYFFTPPISAIAGILSS